MQRGLSSARRRGSLYPKGTDPGRGRLPLSLVNFLVSNDKELAASSFYCPREISKQVKENFKVDMGG